MVKEHRLHWILLRALLCALIINAAQLQAYWSSHGDSPRVLQDVIDESLYLRIAIDQGHFMPQEAIYVEYAKTLPPTELLTRWRPDQTYSHFVVGRAATLLGFNVQQLNLVLDVVCGVVGYLTFSLLFFLILGPSRIVLAELSAVCFLCCPWLFSLENWFNVHTVLPAVTAQLGPVEHTVLPIQEGVESQLSTIWFGITLITFVRCALDRFNRFGRILILGLVSGFGIYLYVLEWVAVTVLIPCLMCAIVPSLSGRARMRSALRALAIFAASNLLAALPGILQIQAIRETKHIFINDHAIYRLGYYLPVEWLVLVLCGVTMLLAFRRRLNHLTEGLVAAGLATIVAEVCALNLQPIFGVATVGIFILASFTRPLLSSLLVAIVFLPFSELRRYRTISRMLLVLFVIAAGYRNYRISTESPEHEDTLMPLVSFVRQHVPKGSVLAMLTYEDPFQSSTKEWQWRWEPNALGALTGTHLLKEALGLEWGALSPEETIDRELALGAVFTGTPKLIRGCAEELILTPKRIFFQQWIPIQLTRRYNCERGRPAIESMTTCDAFKNYKIDYVVWEKEFNLPKPDYLSRAGRSVWSSASGDVDLFKIDREVALKEFCRS